MPMPPGMLGQIQPLCRDRLYLSPLCLCFLCPRSMGERYMGTRPWGSSSQNHHPGLKHPLRALEWHPLPQLRLQVHRPLACSMPTSLPGALSSPHTSDNLDNLLPTFHAPGASHTQRVAKQPPQLSHWHWGTSSCPPGLGWGSGQSRP